MTKSVGLGMTISVDTSAGVVTDISNDVKSVDWETPRADIDVTGVDKSAHERLLGLADMTVKLEGEFNSTLSHTVFRTVPSTSVARTTTLVVAGPSTLAAELLYTTYSLKRDDKGELAWSSEGSLADGTVPTWS